MSLSTTVKSIQDIMRKDVGVDGDAQRISQLGWMLFLKIFDDHESELEVLRDSYKSPLPSRLRWRNWAADPEGITGDELTDFVNSDLFRNLKNLSAGNGRAGVLRAAFEDAYIMHLLKDGGRGAIVLPDGTLFGEGVKTRIKEELLTQCNLHTIVRLPNGVFAPYTGIKTNLLFFTKGEPTKEIWYYEHPYPPGVKSYNKTKPIHIDEFKAEKAWWGRAGQASKRKETELAWRVPIQQIRDSGYNLDLKNPHDPGTTLGDPDKLLAEYQQLLAAVNETREKLKRELQAALGAGSAESKPRP